MAKTPNYSAEAESTIREAFAGEVDHQAAVAELAETLGRSVASVRQKAVRMGLYVKPAKVSKDGSKIETKAAKVARLATACGKDAEDFDSLEKATKAVLDSLIAALEA